MEQYVIFGAQGCNNIFVDVFPKLGIGEVVSAINWIGRYAVLHCTDERGSLAAWEFMCNDPVSYAEFCGRTLVRVPRFSEIRKWFAVGYFDECNSECECRRTPRHLP